MKKNIKHFTDDKNIFYMQIWFAKKKKNLLHKCGFNFWTFRTCELFYVMLDNCTSFGLKQLLI